MSGSVSHRRVRWAVAAVGALAVVVVGAGAAYAVSSGGYEPAKQGCTADADSNSSPGAQPGCKNFQLTVTDGNGNQYAEVGTDQEARDQNVHSGSVAVSPDGTATPQGGVTGTGESVTFDTGYQPIPPGQCGEFDIVALPIAILLGQPHCTLDPTAWSAPSQAPTVDHRESSDGSPATQPDPTQLSVYLGSDDNLDTGEHDGASGKNGTKQSQNGPSDGGAVVVNWHPLDLLDWLGMVLGGDLAGFGANPVPVADAGGGACADGICASAQTRQRTVYQGGTTGSRDVYDYSSKDWDPANCSSGSQRDEKQCSQQAGSDGKKRPMDGYRHEEYQNVYAEPGVQVYEDPDPQGSPLGPYPLPAAYVGTCGVTWDSGGVDTSQTGLPSRVSESPTGC